MMNNTPNYAKLARRDDSNVKDFVDDSESSILGPHTIDGNRSTTNYKT